MNDQQKAFFQNINSRVAKCLYGAFDCIQRSIDAHSISNSLVLEQIAKNDHVIGIRRKMTGFESLNFVFESIGRNQASVFQGLCKFHDQTFSPIDTEKFDPFNQRHLHLYNYRALLKSFHECTCAMTLFQKQYEAKRKFEGEDTNGIYPEGQMAMEKAFSSWMMFKRKAELEISLEKGAPFPFILDAFELDEQQPSLAASSYFSINNVRPDIPFPPFVFLNVIPFNGEKTKVTFSYFPEDADLARRYLSKVLNSLGDHKKYELSKVLLRYSSNLFLSPVVFSTFSAEKVKQIQDYFFRTAIDFDHDIEDPNLMIFGI